MKFMHGSKTGGETAEFLEITIVSHERCFMKREKKKSVWASCMQDNTSSTIKYLV